MCQRFNEREKSGKFMKGNSIHQIQIFPCWTPYQRISYLRDL